MYLEHVNLTVRDVDRATAFYRDLFGFHVRWKGETMNGLAAAHVGDDRQYLAIFEAGTDRDIDHDYTRPGVNHLGFVVDDLDAARARLAELGIPVKFEADYEPGRRLYFHDPDDYEVELVEY